MKYLIFALISVNALADNSVDKPKFKTPGQFKVIDKDSPYYKCYGIIKEYPSESSERAWYYSFYIMKCGKYDYDSSGDFFFEYQLKRTGNLAD